MYNYADTYIAIKFQQCDNDRTRFNLVIIITAKECADRSNIANKIKLQSGYT